MFILETDVEVYHHDKLQLIQNAMAYLESCHGDNTWIWNAEAWGSASRDLKCCRDYWRLYAKKNAAFTNFKRLWDECDTCIYDMSQYRELCADGETKDGTSWTVGWRRMLGLKSKLEDLKDLAEG